MKLTAVLLLLLAGWQAAADTEASPEDYSVATPDGRHVLVMLGPDASHPERNEDLRKKYPESGVFETSPARFLWRLPFYSPWARLAGGGRFAVAWSESPRGFSADSKQFDQTVLWFFDRGSVIKTYSPRRLIKNPAQLPHSVSHFQWAHRIEYDATHARLRVITVEGEDYTFGPTGAILEQKRYWLPQRFLRRGAIHLDLILLALFAGAALIVFLIRRTRKMTA